MSLDALLRPFECKSLKLKNRVVMAPMTRTKSPNGIPTEEVAQYYERRSQNEIGLIVTEGTVIERPASKMHPNIPNFYGEAMPAWQNVTNKVHGAGGAIVPQIWHVGNVGFAPNYNPTPIDSPSGYIMPDRKNAEPMSEEAIADTIAAFAKSAKNAKDYGFDGIELHGAHGYLIDQFFWKDLNKREDKWGGETIAKRNTFAVEIIKACREAVGDDFAIITRLSQWKQQNYEAKIANNPEEMEEWLQPLVDAGTDILHCSQRRVWEPEFAGSDLNFAGWAKKITGVPTISVGSVGLSSDFLGAFKGQGAEKKGIEEITKRLENEEFDLLAIGRALLQDPEWFVKVKEGRSDELQDFSPKSLATLY